ncbi:MAG: glycosyltransferase family 8 protein [Candidatus Liptonbacteria bacterium]|nr:glycosyltransferase family 8 protein [Candidatus Liptonbacteria bacterium]
MEKVSVVFATNDNYAMLLGVALCSLFENKKGDYPISLYVVDFGISAKNKERLETLEKKYGFTINYVLPDKKLYQGLPLGDLSKGFHAPVEAFHRVYLGRFLPPTCRRVINLEVDVVIRGDISELFNVDLGRKTIGAIADCQQEERQGHLKKLRKDINWPIASQESAYFSVGMLLVDLELWRKRGIEEKLHRLIYEYPDKLRYHEQDALNLVFAGDYRELGIKYNLIAAAIPIGAYPYNEPDPLVVHFAGGGKPWYFLSALPYQPEYVYYINKTPWKRRKYRKIMDIYFAKKYGIYPVVWGVWIIYKRLKTFIRTHLKNPF